MTKVFLLLAIIVILYRHLVVQGANVVQAGTIVLAIVYTMSVGDHTIRPHLFTYLFFLLLLLSIHAAETGHARAIWFAPLIIALWANCHGGFLAGLAVLGLWGGVRVAMALVNWYSTSHAQLAPSPLTPVAQGASATSIHYPLPTTHSSLTTGHWPLATALLASVAAAMLNPYGPRLLTFLLQTATVPRPEIQEWQPVDVTKSEGIAYLVLLAIATAALATSKQRRPALAVVLACLAILPLQAFRHLPLFALAVGVLAGPSIAAAWTRLAGTGDCPNFRSTKMGLSPSTPWAAALLPLTGAMLFSAAAWKDSLAIKIDPQQVAYPVAPCNCSNPVGFAETWPSISIGASTRSGTSAPRSRSRSTAAARRFTRPRSAR